MAYVNISLDAFQPLVKWKPHQIDALCQTRGALHDTRHLPIPWLLACWYKHTHRDALKSPQLDEETIKICLVRFRVMGQAENFSTRACVCVRARDTERQHILLLFVFLFCANESEKKKKTRIYLVAIFFHFWNIHKFTHKMYNTNLTFIFIEFWFAYYELKWKRMFFFVFF